MDVVRACARSVLGRAVYGRFAIRLVCNRCLASRNRHGARPDVAYRMATGDIYGVVGFAIHSDKTVREAVFGSEKGAGNEP